MTHQTTTPILPLMHQHIVLLQAMLQQDRFAALRSPVQDLARGFAQLESALREQAQTLEAVLALLALHPSDAYRSHLMQGLLGLQQQHSNCWLEPA
ncbi:hypothetical protein DLM_2325 [Aquitalea magnusonii]|uniref:Uncharacterized protein n=1 Tax=Aquitalea magnusonii TaxID=332411 RepID=A0A3G9GH45_9NEIS|nr:hypothetical protein [Aquitalea magnusonii]BBF85939.1 hypothetical protein DLM_2325 [Aquitalea magnusonii]